MVVKCNFFSDDTYLVFQDDNSRLLICSWFVYKKLRIYFGVDKTKSIVYASKRSKRKIKKVSKLDIIYNNI